MYRRAIEFVRNFFVALKDSRESVLYSQNIVKGLDPWVMRGQYLTAIINGIGSLGFISFFSLAIQKAIDGWINLEMIQMHHVYIFVSVTFLLGIVALFMREYLGQRMSFFSDRFEQLMDDMVVQKIKNLDLGRITEPDFIDLKKMMESRGRYAVKTIWKRKFALGSAILGIVASFGLLTVIDYKVIIIILLPLIPELVKMIIIDTRKRKLEERQVLPRRFLNEYEWCLSSKDMSVQTKLFGFTEYFFGRYSYFRDKMLSELASMYAFERRADVKVGIFEKLTAAIILLYLGYGVTQGSLDVFKILTIFGCAKTFRQQCGVLSREIVNLSSDHLYCLYFHRFMETKPFIDETEATDVRLEKNPRVKVSTVSFSYPQQKGRKALANCNFEILPGQKIALLGKNGCGKTTVLRMLSKVFLPNEGSVEFDGRNVETILQASLHKHLLYVTQETGLPDFPIDESVTGQSRENIDFARLLKASKIVGCDEFISKLPHGYQTQIGVEWPGGVGFSSGQLQRLKLVAALYRMYDPSIYIIMFDEPMAHCDVETRECFYGAIKSFVDKTVIVVAHDMNCLPYFERLIIMDIGQVTEDVVGYDNIISYQHKIALRLASEL